MALPKVLQTFLQLLLQPWARSSPSRSCEGPRIRDGASPGWNFLEFQGKGRAGEFPDELEPSVGTRSSGTPGHQTGTASESLPNPSFPTSRWRLQLEEIPTSAPILPFSSIHEKVGIFPRALAPPRACVGLLQPLGWNSSHSLLPPTARL